MRLTEFRNYSSLSLDLDARPIVLTGRNGAGKTNLLEAVSFLAEGRGLRQARYLDVNRETVPPDSPRGDRVSRAEWAVWARLYGPNGMNEVGTGLVMTEGGGERREVRINGAPAKSVAALADLTRILWLTPAFDGLFTGSAGERRRFLDRLVATTQPGHSRHINAFETAMRQRNALLGHARPDQAWLNAIEVQMAEYAISIAAARRHNVELLENVLAAHSHTAFPRAILEIDGALEHGLGDAAAVDVEDAYREKLKAARGADSAAGRTLNGPHRSDLVVYHGGRRVAARKCSTGEQKILLIGIILAHAGLVKELTAGFAPILLLDEVAAHLDARHRTALFDELARIGGQAWLT
ncbi:MAG: DNA replication/repair protein RecF, partial [Fimbriimonadaceae bacterium]|nr:DNA replication/repair protein RecF [Alphaproteobacteria bacterium]